MSEFKIGISFGAPPSEVVVMKVERNPYNETDMLRLSHNEAAIRILSRPDVLKALKAARDHIARTSIVAGHIIPQLDAAIARGGAGAMTTGVYLRYLGVLGLLAECSPHVPEELRESIERAFADAVQHHPQLSCRRILDRIEILSGVQPDPRARQLVADACEASEILSPDGVDEIERAIMRKIDDRLDQWIASKS